MKRFFLTVLALLVAIPSGLPLVSQVIQPEILPVANYLSAIILKYDVFSAKVWDTLLANDSSAPPKAHLFLSFSFGIFLPAAFFPLWLLIKHYVFGQRKTSMGGSYAWTTLSLLATFFLFQAFAREQIATLWVLNIAAFAAILIKIIIFEYRHGWDALAKVLNPPIAKPGIYYTSIFPQIVIFGIVLQIALSFLEMPPIPEGQYLIVFILAGEMVLITLACLWGFRLPCYVFLLALGVYIFNWLATVAKPAIDGFLKAGGVV